MLYIVMSRNKKAKPHPYRNSFVDCIALDIYETVYGQTSRFIAAGLLITISRKKKQKQLYIRTRNPNRNPNSNIQLKFLFRKSNSKIQIEILTRKSNSNSYFENPTRNLTRNPNSEVSLFVFNSLPLRIVLLQKKSRWVCAPESGAPNDGFLLNALKSLFMLSRVLLDL